MLRGAKGLFLFLCISTTVYAQNDAAQLSLTECISYALEHQPAVQQAQTDKRIALANNRIAGSNWLPQVMGSAYYQHYAQLPVNFVSNGTGGLNQVTSGVFNVSVPAIAATQNIFNTDALLATKAAKLNMELAEQNTTGAKINVVCDVSKAFYDLLLSLQQINVLKDDTARLRKNQQDAYHQYVSGIADKVDYQQASIALNNTTAQLTAATEAVTAKYALLQQLMGYPADKTFVVKYDTAQMLQQVYTDTASMLHIEQRIEYQQLQTKKKLLHANTQYYQLGVVPSLYAYYNYNYEFKNNNSADLYNKAYPNSYYGLQLNVPLFQGLRRIDNMHKARLQETRTDWDVVYLKSQINTEHKASLAAYKSNLNNLRTQRENMQVAREVYDIVNLQYREGIKPYLNVITAETDLRNSEINYLNTLFQLLSSKIDLERAKGDIHPDR